MPARSQIFREWNVAPILHSRHPYVKIVRSDGLTWYHNYYDPDPRLGITDGTPCTM